MERYRKAMERARRERELANARRVLADKPADRPAAPAARPTPTAVQTETPVAPPETAVKQPETAVREPAAPRSDPVAYTQTRVVPIDAQKLRAKCVITGEDADPYADVYRMLRTRFLQRMRQNGWHSVAVTSPGSAAGKSLTAVNLAISLAMEETSTVLLVDFDLRRPAVHRYFDHEPELGISDLLLRNTPLTDILFSPSIERLVVAPGRESLSNSTELMSAPRTIELVEELKTRYPERIVIFDLPPLLTVSDALAFSPQVDAVLLVVEDGVTHEEELAAAMELLEGRNVIGTVLNKTQEVHGAYYHY